MKKYFQIFCGVCILLLGFLVAEIVRGSENNSVQVFFFDVGQGDSELIQKGDFQILIDGGPDATVLQRLGEVMPLSDRKIDEVILTHPHADHLVGLNQVLDRYEVGKIYGSGVLSNSNTYLEFLNKIKDKKVNFIVPAVGDTEIPFADSILTFLWPGDKFTGKNEDNLNYTSIVNKFCYFDHCAMFTGDIEKEEQDQMFDFYRSENNLDLFKSEILKVPHHGSKNGANDALYEFIIPKFAVISAGKDNQFGHPHKEALDIIAKYGAVALRTDEKGTIKFIFTKDGIAHE